MSRPPDGALETRRARAVPIVPIILAAMVVVAVALRLLWLDRLPGIHGDEGWEGLLGQRWARGDFSPIRTATGNWPGPIEPAMVALGQFVLPSRFLTLRIPSVLASFAAMALAWHIGRRHFDAATARLALLLMAILPANIAFARFGWDPSFSGMITLAALTTALERRAAPTALLYGLALWTHPTNIFIAPLLGVVFFASQRAAGQSLLDARNVVLAAAMLALTAALMATAIHAGDFADSAAILSHLAWPSDLIVFVLLLARLMAGRPWFEHLAGSSFGAWSPLIDVIGVAMLIGALWFAVRSLRGWRFAGLGIPAGWLAMLAGYFLVAGAGPLNAGTERYAFVLVAPTAIVLAMALRSWLPQGAGGPSEAALTGTLGAGLLAATIALYFVPLARWDDGKVDGATTGRIEPKEAVARWATHTARPDRPIRLVTEDWQLAWPLAYRLRGAPVQVVNAQAEPRMAGRASDRATFDVVFAGTARDRELASASAPAFVATGNRGGPIVRVWPRPRVR